MEFDTQSLRSLALAVWVLLQGPPTPLFILPCVPRPPSYPSACPALRPTPLRAPAPSLPGRRARSDLEDQRRDADAVADQQEAPPTQPLDSACLEGKDGR